MKNTFNNLEIIINNYCLSNIFIDSDRKSIEGHFKEAEIDPNDYPTAKFWCELSWGDEYDFSHYGFGDTLIEAVEECLDNFKSRVRDQAPKQVRAAKDAGIYQQIMVVKK